MKGVSREILRGIRVLRMGCVTRRCHNPYVLPSLRGASHATIVTTDLYILRLRFFECVVKRLLLYLYIILTTNESHGRLNKSILAFDILCIQDEPSTPQIGFLLFYTRTYSMVFKIFWDYLLYIKTSQKVQEST